jgi:hypothetical protein
VWRIRSNLELQNAYKSSHIVAEMKIRKLEWLGHLVRMEDTCIQKIIFNIKPEGRCGVGRPEVRWLDDVEADMKTLDKYKKMDTRSSRQKRMDGNSKGD